MSNGVFAVTVAPQESNRREARGHAGARRHRVIAGFAALACALCLVTPVFAAPVLRSGAVGVAPGASALGFPPIAGTVLYDNTGNPADTYYAGQNGAEAVDDVHMVSGGPLGTIVFEYYEPVAGPPITATVRIYTNPGGLDGDLIPLAGPYVIQVPAAGRGLATVSLPDKPVAGANLWVGVQFSTATAGLIIKDVPSVGTSHDLYFENGDILWFGGTPKANFALRVIDVPTYPLDVTIVGQGTVTKSPDQPEYVEGSVVRLTATADPNWHFVGWSIDASGTDNPLDVTMDAAKSVTATFAIDTYALGVTIVGQGLVTKSPDQPLYDHGSIVQLDATPETGWHFVGWSDDASGSDNPLDVTMDAAKSVTATFAINTYALDVTTVGQGTVTKNPDQALHDHGSIVRLTPAPASGWHFVEWSGDASGSANPLDVTMDAARSVTATFAINTYALDVTTVGQGAVTKDPDQALYDHGTIVRLTPVAAANWHFDSWGGDASGAANPLDVTMDAAKSVTATFAIDTHVLNVTIVGQGSVGVATGPSAAVSTTTAGPASVTMNPHQVGYDHGTVVQLSAVPETGWHFVEWSGDASGSASPFDLTMDTDKAVSATFAINTYSLSVTTVGQGTVTKSPDQALYPHGAIVRLTAAAVAGWHFAGWSADATGSLNPLDVTMNGAKSVTATFEINTNLITNGSFEASLNGWNGYNEAVLARVTGGQDGTRSVRVTGPSPSEEDFGLNDSPSWITDAGPAGTTYEISAYIRSSSSTSPVRMRIREYLNDVRIGSREYSDTQALTTSWKKISMQYVTRATGTSFDFQILNIGEVAGDVFFIDNVVIQSLGTGTSAALSILHPTASSVLITGGYCLARWSPPPTGADSTVLSVTVDDGDTWTVLGSVEIENLMSWHLPDSPTRAALFVQSYSNGVMVGDAVSDLLDVTTGTLAVGDESALPRAVYLAPPQPAPFRTYTTLNFGLPKPADVQMRVLDLQGRVVATLADGTFGAGRHDLTWNGTTSRGSLGAGIYFIRLDALGHHVVRKLAITR